MDDHRLIREKNMTFDQLRLAEFEIQRRWSATGDVPDEWWGKLLTIISDYERKVRRCRAQLR